MGLKNWLKLPSPDYDLDDPAATLHHREIILEKRFLRRIYEDYYRDLRRRLDKMSSNPVVLEIGSGGGFLKDVLPSVTTTDILPLSILDVCCSALSLPFKDGSVDMIFMMNVLHHLPDAEQFLKEAQRVLKPGGEVMMIEPANTTFGRFIYQHFHHEPFEPSGGWTFESKGPLSDANGALPWIIFQRDRVVFEEKFPQLHIESIEYHDPFRYLLSGGVSMRQLVPDVSYSLIKAFEDGIRPLHKWLGLFHTIVIKKH